MRARSLISGLAALSLAFPAFAQQTVVGGPGAPPASGGAGSPGGSSGQIQFNNASAFGGISTLTNASGVITNSANATGASLALTGVETASTAGGLLYVNLSNTASSAFSASGTALAINTPTGFAGNLIDAQVNGANVFKVTSTGSIGSGAITSTGNVSFSTALQKGGQTIIGAVPTGIAPSQGFGGASTIVPVGNSSLAFQATVGATPTTGTFTITFSAAAHGWSCSGADTTTTTNVIGQVGFTTTTAVMQNYVRTTGIAGALTASDVVVFTCAAF